MESSTSSATVNEDEKDKSNAAQDLKNVKEQLLVYNLDISVTEAEKRVTGALSLRDFFMVYLVETKLTDPEWKRAGKLEMFSSVWRRYTEFEMLRECLESRYPYVILAPLPEKRVHFAWQKVTTDTVDPDFVDRRRAGLENFLLRVASHPEMCVDPQFIAFLQKESNWQSDKDGGIYPLNQSTNEREILMVYVNGQFWGVGLLQIAESKFKTLSAIRLKEPDKRFEQIKNYSNELQNNMTNLLRIRARLAERLYGIHKLHANYGRIFSEWSAIEKDMGDGLQKAGHYMDSVAAGIDAALEEEELIADQLKEYLFSAESLQTVCKRQELLQLDLERAQEAVVARNSELDRVHQGKLGLMSRLFGSVDTDEVRGIRANLIEQRIEEGKDGVRRAQSQRDSFSELALADVERFRQQKVIDLRETFINYVVLQMKIARKGLQTWVHIRDCLESVH